MKKCNYTNWSGALHQIYTFSNNIPRARHGKPLFMSLISEVQDLLKQYICYNNVLSCLPGLEGKTLSLKTPHIEDQRANT